uniref:Uncharacterized protein n=1 Tax=Kalanchoe fedtschenkoi TaxID=63787 RepID=A0A7N0TKJ4_KALFE
MASTMSLALLMTATLFIKLLCASSFPAVYADAHSEPLPLFTLPPTTHAQADSPSNAPAQAPTHHHHHHHYLADSPGQAPASAPTHHPRHHPSHSPAHAPARSPTSLPPRKFVAVQGVVFCKSCKYRGAQTLLDATPLPGAVVKLQCNNTVYPQEVKVTTDKNGYFFIQAPKTVTSYGAHKCKTWLVGSPDKACDQPTDMYGGSTGSYLWLNRRSVAENLPFDLFSAGPFAFEPAKSLSCSR